MSASYTYLGTDERYYPDLGVWGIPGGDPVTFDHKPDDNWAASSSKKAAAAAAANDEA